MDLEQRFEFDLKNENMDLAEIKDQRKNLKNIIKQRFDTFKKETEAFRKI